MPRYVAYRTATSDAQAEFEGPTGQRRNRNPDGFGPEGTLPPGAVPLHRFDAPDEPDAAHAWRYFAKLRESGCPADFGVVGDAAPGASGKLWRYRGDVG